MTTATTEHAFPVSPRLVATAAVQAAVEENEEFARFVAASLWRYRAGDDGDLDANDKRENQRALKHGSRILASYLLPSGLADVGSDDRLWIITDARIAQEDIDAMPDYYEGVKGGERYCTTILWPSDY